MRVEVTGIAAAAGADRASGTNPNAADPQAVIAARRQRQEALQHPAINDALDILRGEILEIRPLGGGS